MATDKSYEDGMRDGQLKAIEAMQHKQERRLDSHSSRLTLLERICWVMFGIVATIQFIPAAQQALALLTGNSS